MLTIFGAAASEHGGLLSNPIVKILGVFLITYLFIKFCSWAKNFELSNKVKIGVYVLTGIGLVYFNILYSQGNALIHATGDWSGATTALLISFVWVFVFSFVLMAQKKA